MKRPILTIASGNPKKVAEIEAMLGPLPIDVQKKPKNLNIEETGSNYFENAMLKAEATAKATESWAIADDSGLEIDSLNNAPGIYSARYAKTNENKLKKIFDALHQNPYRSARFHSVMVLCGPKGNLITSSEGICWGEILESPAYIGGEFESIFWVKEAQCSYGELNQEQLTRLGSRAKAARQIAPFLLSELGIDQ